MSWKYKLLGRDAASHFADFGGLLREMDDEGWELVTEVCFAGHRRVLVFRRPKEEATQEFELLKGRARPPIAATLTRPRDSKEDLGRWDEQERHPGDEELVTGVGPGGYEGVSDE